MKVQSNKLPDADGGVHGDQEAWGEQEPAPKTSGICAEGAGNAGVAVMHQRSPMHGDSQEEAKGTGRDALHSPLGYKEEAPITGGRKNWDTVGGGTRTTRVGSVKVMKKRHLSDAAGQQFPSFAAPGSRTDGHA